MAQLKPILRDEPTVYFVQFVPYAPKEVIGPSSLLLYFYILLTSLQMLQSSKSLPDPLPPRPQ